jgi:hypothetical protein
MIQEEKTFLTQLLSSTEMTENKTLRLSLNKRRTQLSSPASKTSFQNDFLRRFDHS